MHFRKILVMIIVGGFACAMPGRPLIADDAPQLTGAFHAVSVADLDRSIAWYSRHLGFKLETRGGNDERDGALLTRPGTIIELARFSGAVSRDELRNGLESHLIHGIFKLGFVTTDIDETFARLDGEGVSIFFPVVTASDGQRTFGVLDPDGNIIQFFGE